MTFATSLFRSLVVAGLALSMAAEALALEKKPFSTDEFAAAQAAGKPVLVHVSASWCPTCKAQHMALDGLAAKPEFDGVTVMEVDFDSQKDVLKTFRANQQSTMIAFHGSTETGRLVGQTSPRLIGDLINAALNGK